MYPQEKQCIHIYIYIYVAILAGAPLPVYRQALQHDQEKQRKTNQCLKINTTENTNSQNSPNKINTWADRFAIMFVNLVWQLRGLLERPVWIFVMKFSVRELPTRIRWDQSCTNPRSVVHLFPNYILIFFQSH